MRLFQGISPCADPETFYLLHPDGHIGLAGTGFDAALLMRYLAGRLGCLLN